MNTAASSDNLFAGLKAEAAVATAAPQTEDVDLTAGLSTPTSTAQPSELDSLKARAKVMGITFSNNISVETLRAKIEAKVSGETEQPTPAAEVQATTTIAAEQPVKAMTPQQIKNAERQTMVREQMKLVRCRITNMNPAKANLNGEYFTFGNRVLGTVRKYVPYQTTDDGFHLPYCIVQELKERKFVNVQIKKDSKGLPLIEHDRWVREFAIEILPQLTTQELAALATTQAAARSID